MTVHSDRLLLAVIRLADLRPLRPRIVLRSLIRSLRHHLDLSHRFCTMPDGRSYTVIASITTTDDDHILILGIYILFILKI